MAPNVPVVVPVVVVTVVVAVAVAVAAVALPHRELAPPVHFAIRRDQLHRQAAAETQPWTCSRRPPHRSPGTEKPH